MTKNKGVMRKVLRNVIRGSVLGSVLGFVWGEVIIVWVAFSNFSNDIDAFFRILKFCLKKRCGKILRLHWVLFD